MGNINCYSCVKVREKSSLFTVNLLLNNILFEIVVTNQIKYDRIHSLKRRANDKGGQWKKEAKSLKKTEREIFVKKI